MSFLLKSSLSSVSKFFRKKRVLLKIGRMDRTDYLHEINLLVKIFEQKKRGETPLFDYDVA